METEELKLIRRLVSCTLHIQCSVLDHNGGALLDFLNSIYCDIFKKISGSIPLVDFFKAFAPQTVYGMQDRFLMYYGAVILPDTGQVFIVGPCLLEKAASHFIAKVLKINHIGLDGEKSFQCFYDRWPVLDQAMVHTLMRIIGEYCYKGKTLDHRQFLAWDSKLVQPVYVEDSVRILTMKSLEMVYDREKALLEAVSRGKRQEAFDIFISNRSLVLQPMRYSPDTLRDAKDKYIAFHGKLKQAAEQGGVHPIHLEETSAEFCRRIEEAEDINDIHTLAQNMLRRYIQLVRRMAVPQCSTPVRQAVNLIHLDLSAPLSVKYLAEAIQVHPNYLSRIFKQEMGIALTEYINKSRIIRAMKYLGETELQVGDIGLYVGFEDINYFSRVFKQYVECSPSQYRKIARGYQLAGEKEERRLLRAAAGSEVGDGI